MAPHTAGSTTPAPAPDSSSEEIQEIDAPPKGAAKKAKEDAEKKASFAKKYKVKERSNEEILKIQQESWRSSVYEHFRAPEIVLVDGEVKYKFVCPVTGSVHTRARWDVSTSNLSRHVVACTKTPRLPAGQQAIDNFAQATTYNPAKFRVKLAIWLARRHRPYALAQDPEFLELLRMLNTKVEVPHPTTVSHDVREIFALSRKNIGKILRKYPGRLHLCLDGWTSPNVISFLGVTVHRVQAGKMITFILDFIKLTKAHTGIYLGQQLTSCLKDYGIDDYSIITQIDRQYHFHSTA